MQYCTADQHLMAINKVQQYVAPGRMMLVVLLSCCTLAATIVLLAAAVVLPCTVQTGLTHRQANRKLEQRLRCMYMCFDRTFRDGAQASVRTPVSDLRTAVQQQHLYEILWVALLLLPCMNSCGWRCYHCLAVLYQDYGPCCCTPAAVHFQRAR